MLSIGFFGPQEGVDGYKKLSELGIVNLGVDSIARDLVYHAHVHFGEKAILRFKLRSRKD